MYLYGNSTTANEIVDFYQTTVCVLVHSMYVGTILYSGTCLRWSLYNAATSLKQPASLAECK